jgi:hypothetical protein
MRQLCAKHHLQGVWGRATPSSGEREGRSPLAFAKQYITFREAVSITCRGLGAAPAQWGTRGQRPLASLANAISASHQSCRARAQH